MPGWVRTGADAHRLWRAADVEVVSVIMEFSLLVAAPHSGLAHGFAVRGTYFRGWELLAPSAQMVRSNRHARQRAFRLPRSPLASGDYVAAARRKSIPWRVMLHSLARSGVSHPLFFCGSFPEKPPGDDATSVNSSAPAEQPLYDFRFHRFLLIVGGRDTAVLPICPRLVVTASTDRSPALRSRRESRQDCARAARPRGCGRSEIQRRTVWLNWRGSNDFVAPSPDDR
jgi:hypothetical protein